MLCVTGSRSGSPRIRPWKTACKLLPTSPAYTRGDHNRILCTSATDLCQCAKVKTSTVYRKKALLVSDEETASI